MHFLRNSLKINSHFFCFFLSILGYFCFKGAKWRFLLLHAPRV